MKKRIEDLLTAAFQPAYLEVLDESHKHADHNPDAVGGGTHFQVTITAEVFRGKTPLQRHRMVYAALADPLKEGVHALAVRASGG